MENLFDSDRLIQFDALSHYKKYNEIFDMDEVPEAERNAVAQDVAEWVMQSLKMIDEGQYIQAASSSCNQCSG